ncbi:hypothetical protein [Pseudomonas aeruginosa]|nr:hypothetical protein HMJ40_23405 [Pseudomonas aeruginosa]
MKATNRLLADFEKHTRLGPTFAAELLGVAYSTYNQYRNFSRATPKYLQRHIQAVQLLPESVLQSLIKEHVRDGWQAR